MAIDRLRVGGDHVVRGRRTQEGIDCAGRVSSRDADGSGVHLDELADPEALQPPDCPVIARRHDPHHRQAESRQSHDDIGVEPRDIGPENDGASEAGARCGQQVSGVQATSREGQPRARVGERGNEGALPRGRSEQDEDGITGHGSSSTSRVCT